MEINLPMNASIDDLIKSTKKEFKSKNVLCSINFDVWKYFICQTENNIFQWLIIRISGGSIFGNI